MINMKNKNSKYDNNSGLVIISLKYCCYIFCLTLMPFNLLTFVTGVAYANSEKLVEYKLTQDNLSDSNDSSEQLKRQLWKSDITPVTDENDRGKSGELKQLIEQIRSIKIQPQEQTPKLVVPPKIIPANEPNGISDVTIESAMQEEKDSEPNLPYTPISSETVKMLRSLSQNPQKIDNPLELGELLFRNGNYKEAVLFYREALNRADSNRPDASMDRAWLLFQTGNCLRNSDMDQAEKMYSQLITEFPNSLWADMAVVQTQFIAWYKKDEPQKLVNQNKPKNIRIN